MFSTREQARYRASRYRYPERDMLPAQSYCRQVCSHLQHRKNRTSDSSAARSWRSHQNARLCPHLGHRIVMVGSVATFSVSSMMVISRSPRVLVRCRLPSVEKSLRNPHFRHFIWPPDEIIRDLHLGQNIWT